MPGLIWGSAAQRRRRSLLVGAFEKRGRGPTTHRSAPGFGLGTSSDCAHGIFRLKNPIREAFAPGCTSEITQVYYLQRRCSRRIGQRSHHQSRLIMQLRFEWDERKAVANLSKHKVSFEEAQTVFFDPLARIFDDEWHSTDEPREIIIGHSSSNQLLLVCFTEWAPGLIRIISARCATKQERRDYQEGRNE